MTTAGGNPKQVSVHLERRGAIAVLTLDRPQAANAFGPRAVEEFRAQLDLLRQDTGCMGLIVTGSGSRHFCSGGDVKAYAGYTGPDDLNPVFDDARRALDELEAMPLVTVAAINGVAMGGGLELALACDFRIAHADASLSLPQVRMGIIPGWYVAQRLITVCGKARAARMALSGRRFTAAEALALGAIDEVATGSVVDAALQFLAQFEGASRRGVDAFKRVMREHAMHGPQAGRQIERRLFAELWFHPERKR